MEQKNIIKAAVKITWETPAVVEINKSDILAAAVQGSDGTTQNT